MLVCANVAKDTAFRERLKSGLCVSESARSIQQKTAREFVSIYVNAWPFPNLRWNTSASWYLAVFATVIAIPTAVDWMEYGNMVSNWRRPMHKANCRSKR